MVTAYSWWHGIQKNDQSGKRAWGEAQAYLLCRGLFREERRRNVDLAANLEVGIHISVHDDCAEQRRLLGWRLAALP